MESYAEGFRQRAELTRQDRRSRAQAVMAALPRLKEVFQGHPEVASAYLFGSVIEGELGKSSDVDVAVSGRLGGEFFALWRELDEICPVRVDLVALEDTSATLQSLVRERGRLVHERRPSSENPDR